jgi:hypothetical protein
MRRAIWAAGVLTATWAMLAEAPAVRPCGYGMPSPLSRFLEAETVLVGRVIGIEDQNVMTLMFSGAGQPQEFTVAVVDVQEHFKGTAGQTQVRVGFPLPQKPPIGQEICFFLIEHFAEPFYLATNQIHLPLLPDQAVGREIDRYRRWGRLLRDSLAGLTATDAKERLDTATLLIARYRTPPRSIPAKDLKPTPIDAKESRLILEALAEADWSKVEPGEFRWTPWRLFALLGPKEGWNPQGLNQPSDLETAAKRWLKSNAMTFRINALVGAE